MDLIYDPLLRSVRTSFLKVLRIQQGNSLHALCRRHIYFLVGHSRLGPSRRLVFIQRLTCRFNQRKLLQLELCKVFELVRHCYTLLVPGLARGEVIGSVVLLCVCPSVRYIFQRCVLGSYIGIRLIDQAVQHRALCIQARVIVPQLKLLEMVGDLLEFLTHFAELAGTAMTGRVRDIQVRSERISHCLQTVIEQRPRINRLVVAIRSLLENAVAVITLHGKYRKHKSRSVVCFHAI